MNSYAFVGNGPLGSKSSELISGKELEKTLRSSARPDRIPTRLWFDSEIAIFFGKGLPEKFGIKLAYVNSTVQDIACIERYHPNDYLNSKEEFWGSMLVKMWDGQLINMAYYVNKQEELFSDLIRFSTNEIVNLSNKTDTLTKVADFGTKNRMRVLQDGTIEIEYYPQMGMFTGDRLVLNGSAIRHNCASDFAIFSNIKEGDKIKVILNESCRFYPLLEKSLPNIKSKTITVQTVLAGLDNGFHDPIIYASEDSHRILKECIGLKVEKKAGKPFKSTFKKNTVKGVCANPYNPEHLAFTFEEDDSIVDIERIRFA